MISSSTNWTLNSELAVIMVLGDASLELQLFRGQSSGLEGPSPRKLDLR